jgi:hypothetical protein
MSAKVIGLAGAGRGVGTTHLSIAIAAKLKRLGYKVALLEENASGDFEKISEELELNIVGGSFKHEGLDFYPFSRPRKIGLINQRGYDYIIVDHGQYKSCDRDFFALGSRMLIVCDSSPWKINQITDELFNVEKEEMVESYSYLFQFVSNKKKQKEIITGLQPIKGVYFTPFLEDAFGNHEFHEINQIIGEAVEDEEKKKSGFFAFGKKQPKQEKEDIFENDSFEEVYEPEGVRSLDDVQEEELMEDAPGGMRLDKVMQVACRAAYGENNPNAPYIQMERDEAKAPAPARTSGVQSFTKSFADEPIMEQPRKPVQPYAAANAYERTEQSNAAPAPVVEKKPEPEKEIVEVKRYPECREISEEILIDIRRMRAFIKNAKEEMLPEEKKKKLKRYAEKMLEMAVICESRCGAQTSIAGTQDKFELEIIQTNNQPCRIPLSSVRGILTADELKGFTKG